MWLIWLSCVTPNTMSRTLCIHVERTTPEKPKKALFSIPYCFSSCMISKCISLWCVKHQKWGQAFLVFWRYLPLLYISLDKQSCCDSNLRTSAAVLKIVASKHFSSKHGFSLYEWIFFPLSMKSNIQARPGIQLTVFWGRDVLCVQKWFIF